MRGGSTLAVSRGKVAMSATQAAVPAVASCPNNPGPAAGEPWGDRCYSKTIYVRGRIK